MRTSFTLAISTLVCATAYYGLFPFKAEYVSSAPSVIVVDETEASTNAVIERLRAEGAFKNTFAYYSFKTISALYPDAVEGGYVVSSEGGALALLAQFVQPPYAKVSVRQGMRTEEVAALIQEKIGWDDETSEEFVGHRRICALEYDEGKLFPTTYLVAKDATPDEVRTMMVGEFERYFDTVATTTESSVLNQENILTIASLIQREAAGKSDMSIISGIIWNRLFADMPLEIDATLQYAKADTLSGVSEPATWWPAPKSQDKYIDSPYNTYQNKGLPPSPISNPGPEAIEAALSPAETDCIFYLHDSKRKIHCAKTYAQHKRNVEIYLR